MIPIAYPNKNAMDYLICLTHVRTYFYIQALVVFTKATDVA